MNFSEMFLKSLTKATHTTKYVQKSDNTTVFFAFLRKFDLAKKNMIWESMEGLRSLSPGPPWEVLTQFFLEVLGSAKQQNVTYGLGSSTVVHRRL